MQGLSLTTDILEDGILSVVLEGYLDAHTFSELELVLHQAFANDIRCIVLDISGVEYISSAGAGVFIGGIAKARELGGDLVLVGPRQEVREVFTILGLTPLFPLAETKAEALTRLAGSESP